MQTLETNTIFIVGCTAAAAAMGIYYLRNRRNIASFIAGTVSGIVSLFLLEKVSDLFSLNIPLNLFNIAGSLILGVPYVVILAIMNFL